MRVVVAKLTWVEVRRLLRRVRFWLLIILLGAASAGPAVRAGLNPTGPGAAAVPVGPQQLLYPCQYATGIVVTFLSILALLPLALPFVVCDAFPNDRKTKYVVLLESRGATRSQLVISRVLAGLVVSVVAVAVTFTFLMVAALLSAPVMHGGVGPASSFLSDLLDTQPVLYFLLVLVALVLACAGVLAIGTLVGAISSSWLAAVLVPALVVLVGMFLPLPESLQLYNPANRATFLYFGADWANPQSTAAYWLIAGLVVTAAAIFVYRRTEGP